MTCPSKGSRTVRGRRAGFTMMELSIAISIMMIGLVSIVASTSRMHLLRRQNDELSIAHNGLRMMTERIQAQAFRFSSEPENWSASLLARYSPGGAYGSTFDVPGLTPIAGEAAVGTISFVTDETLTDALLEARLGMPRDLDGDGIVNNADVSATARVLPVQLTLRWRSRADVNEVRHAFYVLGY